MVYFFSNLIGRPSQKFGLPFVVLLRSSLGFRGAKYFGLLRTIVGIFLFGIQTYFLSQAFGYLAIRSILNLPISFPNTTGCKKPISGGEIVQNF